VLKDGSTRTVRIRRAHLEEDAGKLLHEAPGGYPIDYSIVDLNRAGTPLLEIVTEPDLSSGEEVAAFGQELQKLVQFLGVSHAQMQMGHMRFEPNINVHITDQHGQVHKTAITEIKNLNSFSVLQRATDYEVRRQIDHWIQTGSPGRKSTMGWDEATGTTFLQREKEEAHDYRYFPDPDLVPVEISDEWLDALRARIGELPAARRARFVDQYGLSPADAEILAGDRGLADFYEAALTAGGDARRAANLLINVVAQIANRAGRPIHDAGLSADQVAQVARLIDAEKLSASSALPLFERLAAAGASASAERTAQEMGLIQSSDTSAIDAAIDALIAQNPRPLQDYRAGKQAALGALTGMLMRSAKGLNPRIVQDRLKAKLGG
jgi:aspartyl-tRNA(Asn)/glutamyl-tRNA(Gln) amidotransferase subunit B